MASLSNRLFANKRFEFSSKAFAEDKFAVVNMEGFEAISQPFRFTLTLVSDDASIDFDKMLENPATFSIYAPDGASHTPYHGVLAEFDQLHRADGYVFYRATLVPRLWRLSLYRISEVYLNEQTIPATLETVLKNGRLTSADYELKLTSAYRPRSFVCQYQETHLDFLSRWTEKEGMYYYFDHADKFDKLIIVDSRTMHDAQATRISYRPGDELETGVASDSVQDFVCRQRPLPNQVVLQDFNHRKAAVQLKAQATVSASGIGEVMLYGENFRDLEEGNRYAKLRAEEIVCGGKVFSGESTAVGMRSGYFVELSRHYREDFNGQYLVTEIHHQGSQAGALLSGIRSPFNEQAQGPETSYHNSFRAIASSVQFRAERVTAKPRVAGTMSATIDSEGSGEYAELDAYGQYKVQLPFDRTDKNANKGSARVRMATPYSGSDHGMHFPLHKNAEVLLSFIDGDPDQPVIVGAVPNSENANIVSETNAHDNRISTAGGNQMFMGDTRGREALWLHSPFHNSAIGIGSTEAAGGGSIWTSTAGSSDSVTVGSSNSLVGGTKTTLSLTTETAIGVGLTNKATLGATTNFSWSSDVSWKKGRSVTLDDSDTISLKTDGKLQANNTVIISGGQRTAIKAAVESLKKTVQVAVGVNLAVNAALGAAAFEVLNEAKLIDDTTGKAKPWTPGSYGVTAAQGGASAISSIVAHALVYAAGNAIAEAVKADPTYASNIKVNDQGIDIAVDSLVPPQKSSVMVKPNSVAISSFSSTTPGTSTVQVKPGEINLSANGVPALTSNLKLSNSAAELSTQNPTGTVSMLHPVGGSAKMTVDGFIAKSSLATVSAESSQGASMAYGKLSSVNATPNQVLAEFGKSSMTLNAASASLEALGSTLSLAANGLRLDGALIQIG